MSEQPRRRSFVFVGVAAGVVGLIVGGLTVVAAQDSGQVINACVNNRTGAVRVVDDPASCTANGKNAETALSWNQQGPQGPAGPAGATGPAGEKGDDGAPGVVTAIANTQSPLDYGITDSYPASFVVLSASIDVPDGGGWILARFSGESSCAGGTGDSHCVIDIRVDGQSLDPGPAAFDSSDVGTETIYSYEQHAIDRFASALTVGTHSVEVHASTTSGALFRLDDSVLVLTAGSN